MRCVFSGHALPLIMAELKQDGITRHYIDSPLFTEEDLKLYKFIDLDITDTDNEEQSDVTKSKRKTTNGKFSVSSRLVNKLF